MNRHVPNPGLPISEDDLRKLMDTFGRVSSAKVVPAPDTRRKSGSGFSAIAPSKKIYSSP